MGDKRLRSVGVRLSLRSPSDHHIDVPSAAARTDERLAPIEDTGVAAVTLRHLCRIGFDLMPARLAPHDKPDLRSGGDTERHWRAAIGLHPRSGASGPALRPFLAAQWCREAH
jgi:hypothetical protein